MSRCALAKAVGLLKRVVSGGGKGVALELLLSSELTVAAGVQSCFDAPVGLLPTFESMTPRRLSEARAVRTARVAITVATCELALKTTLKVWVESSPSMISGDVCGARQLRAFRVGGLLRRSAYRLEAGELASLMSSSVCARELIVSASVARRTLSRVGTRR